MAQFDELMKELQGVIKDIHIEGNPEKAIEISRKLQAFSGAQAQTAYIVNISDQRFQVPRTYYNIWVQPCAEGEEYHLTEVTSVIDHMDMGLGTSGEYNPATGKRAKIRTVPIPFSAEMIANDVCQQVNGNISDGAFVGVGMSLTNPPSKALIKEMKDKFRKFNEEIVRKANMDWAMKPDYRMIPDSARRAVVYLGRTDVEWYAPQRDDWTECPACQAHIRPGLAKCPIQGCGAILDVAKCIEFGIPVPESMMPKKKGDQKQPGV